MNNSTQIIINLCLEDLVGNLFIYLKEWQEDTNKISYHLIEQYSKILEKYLKAANINPNFILSRNDTLVFLNKYQDYYEDLDRKYVRLKKDLTIDELIDMHRGIINYKALLVIISDEVITETKEYYEKETKNNKQSPTKYYKLILNSTVWDYDQKHMGYVRKKVTDKIILQKAPNNYCYDGMPCNYITNGGIGIRIRTWNDSIIIEPSGIVLPKENLIKITNYDNNNTQYLITNIGKTTYLCNLISDYTRGGKEIISRKELLEKDYEIKTGLVKSYYQGFTSIYYKATFNPSFISPYDFMCCFLYHSYINGKLNFSKDKLIEYLIDKKNNTDYNETLWNIEIERYEHYDTSDCLDNAIFLLRYLGYIYPNYDDPNYEQEGQYNCLNIDSSIKKLEAKYKVKTKENPYLLDLLENYYNKSKNKSYYLNLIRNKSNNM